MRNFQRLAEGVDVFPLLHAIQRQPELWNRDDVRWFHPMSAHREIDDILLRYNAFDKEKDDFVDKVCSSIDVVDYPAFDSLPQARKLIFDLMRAVEGKHLGRVFISRVAQGIGIPPHVDEIAPATEAYPDRTIPAVYYDRYHIVLASAPGTDFRCGGESVYMAPGSVWWFNNQVEHSVFNNGGTDRIHMVLDIHV